MCLEGYPKLKNVLLVEGLTANLVSISHLCDDDLKVKFDKRSCKFYTCADKLTVMTVVRSQDNCYVMVIPHKCNVAQHDDATLWHKKLGHVNYRNLEKIIKHNAVIGIPKLTNTGKHVCGDCLLCKQTK